MTQKHRTLDQQVAAAEQKLQALKKKARDLENGQKIILGGALLSAARQDDRYRQLLIELAQQNVTRKADVERLAPLIEEFGGTLEHESGKEERQADAPPHKGE